MKSDMHRPWANGLRELIAVKLDLHGPLTTHEAAALCEVTVEAAAPRFSELEQLGRVRDTGERRSPTGKGRPQKVWELSTP